MSVSLDSSIPSTSFIFHSHKNSPRQEFTQKNHYERNGFLVDKFLPFIILLKFSFFNIFFNKINDKKN